MSGSKRNSKMLRGNPAPTLDDYAQRLTNLGAAATERRVTTKGLDIAAVPSDQLLSVVTITYNSAATLERTIQSVLNQTYEHVEHVIIDGGSTDATIDIIRRYEDRLSYWHSQGDAGISDAFNLGIAATRGDYIALVNSDDWMSNDQAELAAAALADSDAAFIFGRLAFHSSDGRLIYIIAGDPDYQRAIRYRMPGVNHPTVVVRRPAYQKVGLFNTTRRIAMDYDWLIRADFAGLQGEYEPRLLGHMSEGGICDTSWTDGLREVRDTSIEHGLPALNAHWQYSMRITRGYIREWLWRLLPRAWVDPLHRLFNRDYQPASQSLPDEH